MALPAPAQLGFPDLQSLHILIISVGSILLLALLAVFIASGTLRLKNFSNATLPYLRFLYAIFLKPHRESSGVGQQSALESFYGTQVCIAPV